MKGQDYQSTVTNPGKGEGSGSIPLFGILLFLFSF